MSARGSHPRRGEVPDDAAPDLAGATAELPGGAAQDQLGLERDLRRFPMRPVGGGRLEQQVDRPPADGSDT